MTINKIVIKKPGGENPFMKSLQAKIDRHFNGKSTTGNYKLFIKTAVIFLLSAVFYFIPYFASLSFGLYASIAAIRGWLMGLNGFNIGHDAVHESYSKNKRLNKILGYTFESMGTSSFFWETKHNLNHHSFTNTKNDDDIETNEFLRLAPWQKWHGIQRFQCVYAFILYGFLHLQWVLGNDIKKYRANAKEEKEKKRMTKVQKRIFWFGKAQYFTKSLILPMILIDPLQGFLSFMIMEFVCGFSISVVFQLAHVQRKSNFVQADEQGLVNEEWAIHQIKTTADFATTNPLITAQLGGLNFQAIHHLFPKISHIHYGDIQKYVRETCREFNIRYNHYQTMVGAIWDHIVYLYIMGKKPPRLRVG